MISDSPATALALADSLGDDPFYGAITADFSDNELRRRETLRDYFTYALDEGHRLGRCVYAPDPALGAAIWLLPASPRENTTHAAAKTKHLRTVLGPRGHENYRRIIEFMGPQADAVVGVNAWYLSIVGVSPSAQDRGLGAALLRPTLAEADQARTPCYLETFGEKTWPFYERLGFRRRASHLEPVTGAAYVIMERLPDRTP